jgi:hypothetical protein
MLLWETIGLDEEFLGLSLDRSEENSNLLPMMVVGRELIRKGGE